MTEGPERTGDKAFPRLILYMSFMMAVFYPFKGLFSCGLSLFFGTNLATIVIPFLFAILGGFLLLNLIANGLIFTGNTDLILFAAGLAGVVFSVIYRDYNLLYNTMLLLLLPVALSSLKGIDDRTFFKAVFFFFLLSTCYLIGESVVLNPAWYGLAFKAPNMEALSTYTGHLVSTLDYDAYVNITDYRHAGAYRTAGYLGNVLSMPVLIAMGATFFYTLSRERFSPGKWILAIISILMLIFSISTTAIIAFVLTALFYELVVRRSFLFVGIAMISVLALFLFSSNAVFTYNRVLSNLHDNSYLASFFDQGIIFRAENIASLVYGNWRWLPYPGQSSHIDLINIVVAYGGIIAFLLYRRLLLPLVGLRRSASSEGKVYSLTVLTAVLCFFHASMALNLNVFMLVILLMIKANDLYRRPVSGGLPKESHALSSPLLKTKHSLS